MTRVLCRGCASPEWFRAWIERTSGTQGEAMAEALKERAERKQRATDGRWVPSPEALESARVFLAKNHWPGEDRYRGPALEELDAELVDAVAWVSVNGWPSMEDGEFCDLRVEEPEVFLAPEDVPGAKNGPSRSEIEALPGEQGVATEDEAEGPAYEPPDREELTPEELELADEVVGRLRTSAHDMSPERVVDDLVRVVDVHTAFLTPRSWPGEADETYREAPVVREIGVVLCRGMPNIEIHAADVMFLWKHAKTWTSRGRVIRSKEKSLSSFDRFLTDGQKAAVIVNFELFKTMNPLQKVFSVYQALRRLDAAGKLVPPHFEGFEDELRIFGGRVFRELVTLRTAAEAAKEREQSISAFQLSLLEAEAGS